MRNFGLSILVKYHSELLRIFPDFLKKQQHFFATKVADHILFIAKKSLDSSAYPLQELPCQRCMELSGGQYLNGYVFHYLNKKLKNSQKWKSPECQQAISILEAARATDHNQIKDQYLIASLNPGGL